MRRAGFTLVEVLVAMVVLEVGLLGVVGTLVLAARILSRAESLERTVTEAEDVYDSITTLAGAGAGERRAALGRVRWSVTDAGALHLEVLAPGDSVLFALDGRVGRGSAP